MGPPLFHVLNRPSHAFLGLVSLVVPLRSPLILDWREDPIREFIVGGIAGRIVAFWECSCRAVFGYIGLESLAITAMEAENPRRNIPQAARRIGRRIIFYYVMAAIALSLNMSVNDPILEASFKDASVNYGGAFVLMMRRWGLPVLADIVNGVTLLAALEVTNMALYLAVTLLAVRCL